MKFIVLTIIIVLLSVTADNLLAQMTSTFAQLHVTEGTLNGKNVSDQVSNDISIEFYVNNKGQLSMVEVSNKSNFKFYGRLAPIYKETIAETKTTDRTDHFYFNWTYVKSQNSKDVSQGSAIVVVSEIYTTIGLGFKIRTMDGGGLKIASLSGFMNGKQQLADQLTKLF